MSRTPIRTVLGPVALMGLTTLAACGKPASVTLSDKDLVDRGRYMVEAGACHDCHSPKIMTATGPMPDPARLRHFCAYPGTGTFFLRTEPAPGSVAEDVSAALLRTGPFLSTSRES